MRPADTRGVTHVYQLRSHRDHRDHRACRPVPAQALNQLTGIAVTLFPAGRGAPVSAPAGDSHLSLDHSRRGGVQQFGHRSAAWQSAARQPQPATGQPAPSRYRRDAGSRCPGWRVRASRMTPRKVIPMSIFKKLAHKAEAAKGGAKKAVGRVTGSSRLKAEGRGDQVKGDTRWPGRKLRTPSRSS